MGSGRCRETIRHLVAGYAHAADRGRFQGGGCPLRLPGRPRLPDGRVLQGRDAIRAFLVDTAAAMKPANAPTVVRHHVASHRIAVQGPDAADGYAYFLVVTARGPDHWEATLIATAVTTTASGACAAARPCRRPRRSRPMTRRGVSYDRPPLPHRGRDTFPQFLVDQEPVSPLATPKRQRRHDRHSRGHHIVDTDVVRPRLDTPGEHQIARQRSSTPVAQDHSGSTTVRSTRREAETEPAT